MEYLSCSIADPLPSEDDLDVFAPRLETEKSVRSSSTPTLTRSSCSDSSSSEDPLNSSSSSLPSLKSGHISPSAIETRRRHTTAIATTIDSNHPALKGRKTIVLSPVPAADHNMPFMTRTPRHVGSTSTPPRPSRLHNRSLTSGCSTQRGDAISPLPTNLSKPTGLHRASSAPSTHDAASKFRKTPAPLRLEAWSDSAAEAFCIRSLNYLVDRQKLPSEVAAFDLLAVDLVNCGEGGEAVYGGLCAHPKERVQRALRREQETGDMELPPFIFAVNLVIPGTELYHLVAYYGISAERLKEIKERATPFGRLMNKFMFEDDDAFRNQTFKLIPRIVDGNFVVRKVVGSKPSILGKKIKQYYVRGERYFELIVDIASDTVAQRIVKLALGYAKSLVVDMMFLLEGATEGTLPERIFGAVRIRNVDFKEKDGKRTVGFE